MKYIIVREDSALLTKENKKFIREMADAVFFTRGVSPTQIYRLVEIFGVTRTHFLWNEDTPLIVYPGAEEVSVEHIYSSSYWVGYGSQFQTASELEYITNPCLDVDLGNYGRRREFIGRLKRLMAQYGAEVKGDAIVLSDGGIVTFDDLIEVRLLYTNRLQVKVVIGETSFTHTGAIEDVINVVPHNYRDILMTAVKEQRGEWVEISCSGSFKDGDTEYYWEFV